MNQFVARANIDHYLGLLDRELLPQNRGTITKLLIVEEDKLGHDIEQLEFAENRATNGRRRLNHIRNLFESFAPDTPEREQAGRLLVNLENLQMLLDEFCHRLRAQITSRGL
ncbi:hypothetical protein JQ594_18760 [Bradyrhizobium manausense]|uniref:hypothetical protein n=1 Tax=Bradyrhizobium manausense TaxID=989370 RepID=UPI001BA75E5D|nr:hypothetical protein [Bradyrhizobium manausense]MBR0687975.1 hypothetical protein [Bradyrhizobium manausense]